MKRLLLFFVFLLTACAPMQAVTQQATLVSQGTPTAGMHVQATPAFTPSPMPSATPTVGYQATANAAQTSQAAAQATTDAINRLMVDATEQSNDLTATMQSNSITATSDSDRRAMMILGWTATASDLTATAKPTVIPLTETRQAYADHVHSTEIAVVVTSMWNTQEAPIVAATMEQVAVNAKYADMNAAVYVFFIAACGVMLIAASFLLIRRGMRNDGSSDEPDEVEIETVCDPAVIYQKTQGTTITVRHVDEGGFVSLTTNSIPCSEAQLSELAERVLNKNESLAVNRFEGNGTLWTRETFYAMRNYMQVHRYVQSASSGMVVLTGQGRDFLRAWLDHQSLPRGVEFSPKTDEKSMSMSHIHEDHAYGRAGGVVKEGLA